MTTTTTPFRLTSEDIWERFSRGYVSNRTRLMRPDWRLERFWFEGVFDTGKSRLCFHQVVIDSHQNKDPNREIAGRTPDPVASIASIIRGAVARELPDELYRQQEAEETSGGCLAAGSLALCAGGADKPTS